MINPNNERVLGGGSFTILLSYSLGLVIVLSSIQLIDFKIFASEENALSEGGQICPLESECNRQNENQSEAHNMTLNVPSEKIENGQGSIDGPGSIVNDSKNVQNGTAFANNTLVNGDIKNSIANLINITTDKQSYNPGEMVGILVKNLGSAQLTFPNSALGLMIRNLASNELYPILSSQVITIIGPGDSKSLQWDQVGIDGSQAPSGNYSASVNSGINTAETSFSIK
jgi:hypothetical protein